MDKPVKKPPIDPCWDYHEMIEYLEEKYKFKSRDFDNSHGQFDEWCNGKGYGKKDPKGKDRNSSQTWYAEYKKEVELGIVKERKYLDFWHYVIETQDDVRNGCEIFINVGHLMENDNPPEFVKTIFGYMHKEGFLDFSQDDDYGELEAWVEW